MVVAATAVAVRRKEQYGRNYCSSRSHCHLSRRYCCWGKNCCCYCRRNLLRYCSTIRRFVGADASLTPSGERRRIYAPYRFVRAWFTCLPTFSIATNLLVNWSIFFEWVAVVGVCLSVCLLWSSFFARLTCPLLLQRGKGKMLFQSIALLLMMFSTWFFEGTSTCRFRLQY